MQGSHDCDVSIILLEGNKGSNWINVCCNDAGVGSVKLVGRPCTMFDMIWYDMMYLLTAIELISGGSNAVHIYTQTI